METKIGKKTKKHRQAEEIGLPVSRTTYPDTECQNILPQMRKFITG